MTAEKFGQASNDPRVVLSQQAQSQVTPEPKVTEQAVVKAPAIRGTVGEFIRATLPEAQTRLTADGVINCFIETVALHMAQAQSSDNGSNVSNTVSAIDSNELANQSFNFSNYGYQPLAADYLARFETMTQAVSQFAATQGKTDVEPRAISKRASNDPRGQHPDYQEPAVLSLPTEQAADTSIEQTVSETADNQVDAHSLEANALASQAQADAVSADSEQLLEADRVLSASTNQPAEENAAAENLDSEETSVTSDETTADTAIEPAPESKVEEAIKEEEPTKEEIQAAKSKTTIASYKNMIENVAEQLLPQTGMFNLTTPKVPKARTRKPKTDHKKPTQAEQLDTDNSDS